MRLARVFLLALILLPYAAFAAQEAPPKFVKKPTAKKVGNKVRIAFEVDRETDVTVTIEDAKGKIVRHLVSGVLGTNAPVPLKSSSLAQVIEWDGKADYRKPAGAGPYQVKVALGLGAKYDRVLAEDVQNIGTAKSIAAGPDGTLYACVGFGAQVPNWSGERIVALDRDGKYLRTIAPYPVNLKEEQVSSLGLIEVGDRKVPLWKSIANRSFYSGDTLRKSGMAVTKDGVVLKLVGGYRNRGPLSITAIGSDGSIPWGKDVGPVLNKASRSSFNRPFICVSSDGKHAYVSGMSQFRMIKKRAKKFDLSAIYRVKLPERTPCEPFYGDPENPGKEQGKLSTKPRGVAVDGKGNLLIADHDNDRVVIVSEADGKYVGELAVVKPDGLGVDPASGAVYVTRASGKRGGMELVKYSGWKNGQELYKLALKKEGNPDYPWTMTVDASAKPVIVWASSDRGSLLRIEDTGDSFASKKVNTGEYQNQAFVDVNVDRFRPDKEVYFRCGQGNWYRYNEDQDKFSRLRLKLPGAAGTCIVVGTNGDVYAPAYSQYLYRFTRDGKPKPWEEGSFPKEYKQKNGKIGPVKPGPKHTFFFPVSMTYMTHTIGVRHDGHMFLFEPGHPGGRPPKMLREYLPTGKRVSDTPIIWKVSDVAVGPKFDQQGNIYIAEQVKPLGQPHPPEFNATVGKIVVSKTYHEKQNLANQICTMYGSIVKFSPKGGMVHFGGENPFEGEAKPDPELKTSTVGYYSGYRFKPVKLTGATWIRMGISHVDMFYCNCESTRFDVDEFGRVWYPDLGRFRVGVMDTNGNDLMHFGSYGNADSRGSDSKNSALAEPDIAFAWLIGVGVTDKYAYMGDSMNRRMLRAKLVYAAEATCEVK